VKALHVPGVRVSNSLSRRHLRANESSRVGYIDSIVLQVCYATDSYHRLRRIQRWSQFSKPLGKYHPNHDFTLITVIPRAEGGPTSVSQKRGETT